MPRQISSRFTFYYKFALVPLTVLSCIFFWVVTKPADGIGSLIPFIAFWIVMFSFWFWMSLGLKKVSVDDRNLYVSNYRTEITIPLTEVSDVREFLLSEPRRVTIYLRSPTVFGSKIVFLATYRAFAFLSPHPIVDELIQMSYRRILES